MTGAAVEAVDAVGAVVDAAAREIAWEVSRRLGESTRGWKECSGPA